MKPWAVIVLAGAAAASAAQVRIHAPGMRSAAGYDHHGTPMPADLSEIALGGYLRRVVITRGTLTPLETEGQYYELSDGGRVVLMPVGEMGDALRPLSGLRVEVVGLVRPLFSEQGTCMVPPRQPAPQSYCDDPDLPPTPDLVGIRSSWPRTSITVWSVSDITPFGRGPGGAGSSTLTEVLGADGPTGKTVSVVGRFCGANACGGLGPRPHKSAWGLEDEDAAVWVVGKEPKGKGWRLDPTYGGDAARWLHVVGRIEPCGATRCLKAKSVALAPRPQDAAIPASPGP